MRASHLFDIQGQTLLEFTTIPIRNFVTSAWLFFYSQQGVIHFLNQKMPLPDQKIAAFGPKTAQRASDLGLELAFIGNGKALPSAIALKLLVREDTLCFVRAKNSRQSVQNFFRKHNNISEIVVYDNVAKSNFEVPRSDILIFTSPLNAKTYFSKYQYEDGQKIVAIGPTTSDTLKELGVNNVILSDHASEESLLAVISTLPA